MENHPAGREHTGPSAGNPGNSQRRGPGEKPRDKPVEEEADKDIKPGRKDIENGA